jgi:hypothetical protein
VVRTQIQIDNDTYEALRNAAHRQRKSMSEVAKIILKERLLQQVEKKGTPITEQFSFIGSGCSKERDVSERHDDYLSEDLRNSTDSPSCTAAGRL